jgi:hypothetical protein
VERKSRSINIPPKVRHRIARPRCAVEHVCWSFIQSSGCQFKAGSGTGSPHSCTSSWCSGILRRDVSVRVAVSRLDVNGVLSIGGQFHKESHKCIVLGLNPQTLRLPLLTIIHVCSDVIALIWGGGGVLILGLYVECEIRQEFNICSPAPVPFECGSSLYRIR